MIRTAGASIVGVLLACSPSHGDAPDHADWSLDRSGEPCSFWTQNHDHRNRRSDLQIDLQQNNSVLGYVNGAAAFSPAAKAALEARSQDQILMWIKEYCKAHPTDTLATAAQAFLMRPPPLCLSSGYHGECDPPAR